MLFECRLQLERGALDADRAKTIPTSLVFPLVFKHTGRIRSWWRWTISITVGKALGNAEDLINQ